MGLCGSSSVAQPTMLDDDSRPGPPISRQELEKKRHEFWDTRVTGRQEVWQAVKLALGARNDSKNFEAILKSAGLSLPQRIDKDTFRIYDERGADYELPTFIMKDPLILIEGNGIVPLASNNMNRKEDGMSSVVAVAQEKQADSANDPKIVGNQIVYKIRRCDNQKDLSIAIGASNTIKDLKSLIRKQTGIAESLQKIFFQGKLLDDKSKVSQAVPSDQVIQVFFKLVK